MHALHTRGACMLRIHGACTRRMHAAYVGMRLPQARSTCMHARGRVCGLHRTRSAHTICRATHTRATRHDVTPHRTTRRDATRHHTTDATHGAASPRHCHAVPHHAAPCGATPRHVVPHHTASCTHMAHACTRCTHARTYAPTHLRTYARTHARKHARTWCTHACWVTCGTCHHALCTLTRSCTRVWTIFASLFRVRIRMAADESEVVIEAKSGGKTSREMMTAQKYDEGKVPRHCLLPGPTPPSWE